MIFTSNFQINTWDNLILTSSSNVFFDKTFLAKKNSINSIQLNYVEPQNKVNSTSFACHFEKMQTFLFFVFVMLCPYYSLLCFMCHQILLISTPPPYSYFFFRFSFIDISQKKTTSRTYNNICTCMMYIYNMCCTSVFKTAYALLSKVELFLTCKTKPWSVSTWSSVLCLTYNSEQSSI